MVRYAGRRLHIVDRYASLKDLSDDPAKFLAWGHDRAVVASEKGRRRTFVLRREQEAAAEEVKGDGRGDLGGRYIEMTEEECETTARAPGHSVARNEPQCLFRLKPSTSESGATIIATHRASGKEWCEEAGSSTETCLSQVFSSGSRYLPRAVVDVGVGSFPGKDGMKIPTVAMKVLYSSRDQEEEEGELYHTLISFYRCDMEAMDGTQAFECPIYEADFGPGATPDSTPLSKHDVNFLFSSRLSQPVVSYFHRQYDLQAGRYLNKTLDVDEDRRCLVLGTNLEDTRAITTEVACDGADEASAIFVVVNGQGEVYRVCMHEYSHADASLSEYGKWTEGLEMQVVIGRRSLTFESCRVGHLSGRARSVVAFAETREGVVLSSVYCVTEEGDLVYCEGSWRGRVNDAASFEYQERCRLVGGGPLEDACVAIQSGALQEDRWSNEDPSLTRRWIDNLRDAAVLRNGFSPPDDMVVMGIKKSRCYRGSFGGAAIPPQQSSHGELKDIEADELPEQDREDSKIRSQTFARTAVSPEEVGGYLQRISRHEVPDALFCTPDGIAEGATGIFALRRYPTDRHHAAVLVSSPSGSRVMGIESGVFEDITDACAIDGERETLAAGALGRDNWMSQVTVCDVGAFQLPPGIHGKNGSHVSNDTPEEERNDRGQQWRLTWSPRTSDRHITVASVGTDGMVFVQVSKASGTDHELWALSLEEKEIKKSTSAKKAHTEEGQTDGGSSMLEGRREGFAPDLDMELSAVAMMKLPCEASCISTLLSESGTFSRALELKDDAPDSVFNESILRDRLLASARGVSVLVAVGLRNASVLLVRCTKGESKAPSTDGSTVAHISVLNKISLSSPRSTLGCSFDTDDVDVNLSQSSYEGSSLCSGGCHQMMDLEECACLIEACTERDSKESDLLDPGESIPTSILLLNDSRPGCKGSPYTTTHADDGRRLFDDYGERSKSMDAELVDDVCCTCKCLNQPCKNIVIMVATRGGDMVVLNLHCRFPMDDSTESSTTVPFSGSVPTNVPLEEARHMKHNVWIVSSHEPAQWISQGTLPTFLHCLERLQRRAEPQYRVMAHSSSVSLLRPVPYYLSSGMQGCRWEQSRISATSRLVAACPIVLRCEEALPLPDSLAERGGWMDNDRETQSNSEGHVPSFKHSPQNCFYQSSMLACTDEGALVLYSLESHHRTRVLSSPLDSAPTALAAGGTLLPHMIAVAGFRDVRSGKKSGEEILSINNGQRQWDASSGDQDGHQHEAMETGSIAIEGSRPRVQYFPLHQEDMDNQQDQGSLEGPRVLQGCVGTASNGAGPSSTVTRYLDLKILDSLSNRIVAQTEYFAVPAVLGENEHIISAAFLPRDLYVPEQDYGSWYKQNLETGSSGTEKEPNAPVEMDKLRMHSIELSHDCRERPSSAERCVRQRLDVDHGETFEGSKEEGVPGNGNALNAFQCLPCRLVVGCGVWSDGSRLDHDMSECPDRHKTQFLVSNLGRILVFACVRGSKHSACFTLRQVADVRTEGPVTSLVPNLGTREAVRSLGRSIARMFLFAGIGTKLAYLELQRNFDFDTNDADQQEAAGEREELHQGGDDSEPAGDSPIEVSRGLGLSSPVRDSEMSHHEQILQPGPNDALEERSTSDSLPLPMIHSLLSHMEATRYALILRGWTHVNGYVSSLELFPWLQHSVVASIKDHGMGIYSLSDATLVGTDNDDHKSWKLSCIVSDDLARSVVGSETLQPCLCTVCVKAQGRKAPSSSYQLLLDKNGHLRLFSASHDLSANTEAFTFLLKSLQSNKTIADVMLGDCGLLVSSYCQRSPSFSWGAEADCWSGRRGNEVRVTVGITLHGAAYQVHRLPLSMKQICFAVGPFGARYKIDTMSLYQRILQQYMQGLSTPAAVASERTSAVGIAYIFRHSDPNHHIFAVKPRGNIKTRPYGLLQRNTEDSAAGKIFRLHIICMLWGFMRTIRRPRFNL